MISRSLKQLAKELSIPIVALSQLNRSVESRTDGKRPQLSDLRESGAIEQDADMVCFIHRPEYYTRSDQDAEGNDIRGLAEFIVAKHRSGSVDDVKMRFQGRYARFENWDDNTSAKFATVGSRLNSGGQTVEAQPQSAPQGNPFAGGNADFLSESGDDVSPF
jgi:replicative DNA helicase